MSNENDLLQFGFLPETNPLGAGLRKEAGFLEIRQLSTCLGNSRIPTAGLDFAAKKSKP
jgi:hypothetical protein